VPGHSARLVVRDRAGREVTVGRFGEVAPAVREAFDLAAPVFVAELSLTALLGLAAEPPVYRPLPRFPAVQRDLAIVVPGAITAGEIEGQIRALGLPLLVRIALFDVYSGAQVGPGSKSLAFGLTWQAPDRTLTDREVNELHARVVAELRTRFQADVRGQ
jgi:phenylalanyl-tRNA synthetase beta chain